MQCGSADQIAFAREDHPAHLDAVLDEKSAMIGRALGGVQVLGTPQELDAYRWRICVHGVKVSRVIFAGESDLISATALHDVERVCKKRNIALSFLPRLLGLTEQATSRSGCGSCCRPGGTCCRTGCLPACQAVHRLSLDRSR